MSGVSIRVHHLGEKRTAVTERRHDRSLVNCERSQDSGQGVIAKAGRESKGTRGATFPTRLGRAGRAAPAVFNLRGATFFVSPR